MTTSDGLASYAWQLELQLQLLIPLNEQQSRTPATGQFDAALADLTQAVAEETDQEELYEALVCLAQIKHMMGHRQEAVAHMNKAKKIKPLAHQQQLQHLSYIEHAQGAACREDTPHAGQDLSNTDRTRSELEPAQTLTTKGRTLCMEHQYEAAIAELNKANDMHPNNGLEGHRQGLPEGLGWSDCRL